MSRLNTPTDEEIEAALRERAYEYEGRWWFRDSQVDRSYEQTWGIVEACLRLGVAVSDAITANGWVSLVRVVAALEERVAHLERGGGAP